MALPRKPHSLRYVPVEATIDEKVVMIPTWDGESWGFGGQITPGGYSAVLERFGVELERPALLLCDLEAGAMMTEGGRVLHHERTYGVKAPPKLWDATSPTFAEVLLEELDHA